MVLFRKMLRFSSSERSPPIPEDLNVLDDLGRVLVPVIAGVEHDLVSQAVDRVAEALLAALATQEDAPAGEEVHRIGDAFARPSGEPVDEVRHPAGVGFQVGDAELGVLVEQAGHHHAARLDHLGEGVLQ